MGLISLLQAFGSKKTPPYSGPRVRIAVVGAGRMGGFHATHLARIPQAHLIGIVDADLSRAQSLAAKHNVQAWDKPEALFGQVDAVVLAVPTTLHGPMGQLFLSKGIHCLIEKPLASTLSEADALIETGQKNNAIIQVGHIERFNPAVMSAVDHIRNPQFIEVNRLGPYDPRVADVGVIMDLMIHDLDIVLFLTGSPVVRTEAFGAKVLSKHEDIAKVRLHFANGCIADLSASRISIKKYRRIRVFQNDAYLSLDYAGTGVEIYRKKTEIVKSLLDIERIKPQLAKQDPLAAELTHFLDCILNKRTPLVTGEHGRAAIALAQDVLSNLQIRG